MSKLVSKNIVNEIKLLIQQAQQNAVKAVNQERVLLYWNIGKYIVEEEQLGEQRADYGSFLLKTLADELTNDFGTGFSYRQLNFCRQFYLTFPKVNALRSQLNWSQYKLLIRIKNEDKRAFYIAESIKNSWSGRELPR